MQAGLHFKKKKKKKVHTGIDLSKIFTQNPSMRKKHLIATTQQTNLQRSHACVIFCDLGEFVSDSDVFSHQLRVKTMLLVLVFWSVLNWFFFCFFLNSKAASQDQSSHVTAKLIPASMTSNQVHLKHGMWSLRTHRWQRSSMRQALHWSVVKEGIKEKS